MMHSKNTDTFFQDGILRKCLRVFQSSFEIKNIRLLTYMSSLKIISTRLLKVFKTVKNLRFSHPKVYSLRKNLILWKNTDFWAICLKLCGNCAFPQSIHTRKLGETTLFFAVIVKKHFTEKHL